MDWSLIAKIWCQIVDILNTLASPVLAVFTIVLAIATVKLYLSTKRYADATDKMARVTERSTTLELVKTMFSDFFPLRTEGVAGTTARHTIMGITDDDTPDARKEKEADFTMRLVRAYAQLANEVFEDIEEEVAQSESSAKPSSTDKPSGEV